MVTVSGILYFKQNSKMSKKLIEIALNCANAPAKRREANSSFDRATGQELTFEESLEISLDGTVFLFASSPKQQGHVLCMLGTV